MYDGHLRDRRRLGTVAYCPQQHHLPRNRSVRCHHVVHDERAYFDTALSRLKKPLNITFEVSKSTRTSRWHCCGLLIRIAARRLVRSWWLCPAWSATRFRGRPSGGFALGLGHREDGHGDDAERGGVGGCTTFHPDLNAIIGEDLKAKLDEVRTGYPNNARAALFLAFQIDR